ncbi:hypothetical protein BDF19DRAFT_498834 [Syncephalis fuscata]|nr:hypothetical protein BDF19DRAFT_498834 [Syncephalis fuscata]
MIAYGPKVLHQTIEGLSYLNRAGIEHYGLYSNKLGIMITYKTKSPEPTVIIGDYGMTRLFPNTVPGAVGKRQTYQVGSAFYSELAYGLIENNPNIKRNSIEACFANIKAAVCGRPVKPPLRKPVSELLKFWQQIYPETKNVFSRQKIKPFLRDVFRLIPDDTNLGLTPDQFLARSDKPLPAQL